MKNNEEMLKKFPTMKSLDADKKVSKTKNSTSEAAPEKEEVIDFSKVKVEPLFEEFVDFDTFSKSDFGAVKVKACEQLLRATALSYLVCMYIKEYSGRLSAFCGCAIAAGSGMACALVYLRGGTVEMMAHTLNNMASSITGMICDGGNQGCTMKGVAAVDAAYKSVEFAMNGIYISEVHGINGNTPEETMRNMGLIASPGMVGTEKTIVEIFEDKLKK